MDQNQLYNYHNIAQLVVFANAYSEVTDMRSSDGQPDYTSSADALNSSLEYGEGSSPKQKKSDGGEYIEDDEMEWRKSAKSALQQQRPPKTYKVRQCLCVRGHVHMTSTLGGERVTKKHTMKGRLDEF